MNSIIDLSSELLVDRSMIRDPYLRLLFTVIGEKLVDGSPWLAVDKRMASQHGLSRRIWERQDRCRRALSA